MNRTFLAAVFLAATAATSYGQASKVLVAQIPFDFQVGKTVMPAGKYKIDESGVVTTVRSLTGSPAAMVQTLPASRHSATAKPSLEFQRYGNDYFLSKIWTGDGENGRALFKSEREKELARNARSSQPEEVALKTVEKGSAIAQDLAKNGR